MQRSTLSGRYELDGRLGNGGMAEVYLARDRVLDRDVAIKMLHPRLSLDDEFVERFRREARSAASLSHPNIVQVYDQGWDDEDGTHFIAMEYVPGGTLKDVIRDRGPLPPREAAGIAVHIARALGAAHSRGVIHRDIKPHNVLMDEGGQPKVADFGIARAVSSATTALTGTVMGTAGYMSPEQALGEKVCPRSDLYSLGVILYEMLVGELPLDADTPVALAVKHVNEVPPPPGRFVRGLPAGLEEVTMTLLSKRPEDRYPDASTLVADLERIRDGLAPDLDTPAPTTHMARVRARPGDENTSVLQRTRAQNRTSGVQVVRRRRRRRGVTIALVTVLLLAGGLFALLGGLPESEVPAVAGSQEGQQASSEPPDVTGLELEAARTRLTEAGFDTSVEREPGSAAREGQVLSQSGPQDGAVTLTVGGGPDTVATPDLEYASAAASQLEEVGLELGTVTEEYSDSVAAGMIVSQTPATGREVASGSEVDIVVSLGPEPAETVAPAATETPSATGNTGSGGTSGGPGNSNGPGGTQSAPTSQAPQTGTPAPAPAAPPSSSQSGGSIVDEVFDDVGIE